MFVLGLHKLGDWLRKRGGGSKDRLSCLGLCSPGWFASRPSQCVIHILLCCTLNLMVAGTGFRGRQMARLCVWRALDCGFSLSDYEWPMARVNVSQAGSSRCRRCSGVTTWGDSPFLWDHALSSGSVPVPWSVLWNYPAPHPYWLWMI